MRREFTYARLLTVLFFTGVAVCLLRPVFLHESWMVLLQDDCFYYLQVARNIAQGRGSTFNGIVPTNGYQPLWLWILTGATYVTTRPEAVFWTIAFINFLASVATFLLAWDLLASSRVRPFLLFALSGLTTLYCLTLFFYGMEVTLTVPLMLSVVAMLRRSVWVAASAWRAFIFCLLLSAMMLSRIDTVIFCLLILVSVLVVAEQRRLIRPPLTFGAAVGLSPVLIYFISNRRSFGTWLPVSGMAKQLRDTHVPSLEPWRVFFHPLAATYACMLIAAICLWPVVRHRAEKTTWIFPAVFAFPCLYYFILSCVSDWTLWGWYMYPIRVALCASLAVFCLWPPASRTLQHPLIVAALVVAVFAGVSLLRWRHQQEDIDSASVQIQQFAVSHPGVYAMGDRAGRVGYRLHEPVVQTEGLMMDRNYLAYLESSVPLRDVLAHYGVRYYIATAYEPFTGCFHAREPAKAGPTSKQLKAIFCEAPVAAWTNNGIRTLVYSLSDQ